MIMLLLVGALVAGLIVGAIKQHIADSKPKQNDIVPLRGFIDEDEAGMYDDDAGRVL